LENKGGIMTNRRTFLKSAATSLFLPASASAFESGSSDKSLIIIFLKGGPSTIDMFDMKPDAPYEYRGEFSPISTNTPGIHITEHMPLTAQQQDKFSIIRSMSHSDSNHGSGDHYMLTGYKPNPTFQSKQMPNNHNPSFGSIISHEKGGIGSVPAYICLPTMHKSGGPAYLGATHSPFVIAADPNSPTFSVPDLVPPFDLPDDRIAIREKLRRQLSKFEGTKEVSSKANRKANSFNTFRESAKTLMLSKEAKEAFDIESEPAKMRERYGRSTLGQSCLMARRLVEAGVRCVTIQHTDWDTHDENFRLLKDELLPPLDSAISTLFADLADRGLSDKTVVLVTGEFGRTPKIDGGAGGRGHFPAAFSLLLSGGGLNSGMCVGETDSTGMSCVGSCYTPEDLSKTLLRTLGVETHQELHSSEGRPYAIVNGGKIIKELF
jgi:uncharacterized protein (DUF1501 family)